MGYSLDPISSDCYEGTFCLINKLGIKDEHLLKELDTSFSVARIGKKDFSEKKTDPHVPAGAKPY